LLAIWAALSTVVPSWPDALRTLGTYATASPGSTSGRTDLPAPLLLPHGDSAAACGPVLAAVAAPDRPQRRSGLAHRAEFRRMIEASVRQNLPAMDARRDRPSAAEGAFQRPLEAGAGGGHVEARDAREPVKLAGPVGEHDAVVLLEGVAVRNGPGVLVLSF